MDVRHVGLETGGFSSAGEVSDNPHPHGSVSPILNVVGDEKAADAKRSAEAGTEEETRGEKEEVD